MTGLRPIEPIDTRGLTPKVPATGAPIFEWVDPRTLFVDPVYQRTPSERSLRQIRRIIEGYDWPKFKPPVCALSEGENGELVLKVIDGQHTAIAAASNPHVQTIPIMIVEAPDVRSQASAFIGQNTDRLGVTATQMHVAAVAAGDEDALALAALCYRTGIVVRRGPPSGGVGYQSGETLSVAAIAALLKNEGEAHAEQVLVTLARARLAPIKADHIKAIDLLLTDPQFSTIDVDALPCHMLEAGEAAMKEARAFAATHNLALWRALAAVLFKRAKKKRQPAGDAGRARDSSAGEPRAAGPAGTGQPRSSSPSGRGQPRSDDAIERDGPGAELSQAPDLPDDLVQDRRASFRAWSPGHHVRRCVMCDARFRGGRLATECASCAYEGGASHG